MPNKAHAEKKTFLRGQFDSEILLQGTVESRKGERMGWGEESSTAEIEILYKDAHEKTKTEI